MIFIVILLNIFYLTIFVLNNKERYSYYHLFSVISFTIISLGSMMLFSKTSSYASYSFPIFNTDNKLFLSLAKNQLGHYTKFRIMNFGLIAYLVSMQFYIKKNFSHKIKLFIYYTIFIVYIVLFAFINEPNTQYAIYIKLYSGNNSTLYKYIYTYGTIVYNYMQIIFILIPLYYLHSYSKQFKIWINRVRSKIILHCISLLNILYFIFFVFGTNTKNIFKTDFLGVSNLKYKFIPPYESIVIFILLYIFVLITLMLKYKFLENLYSYKKDNYSIKFRHNDIKNILHSFKNAFFHIKVLANQANMENNEAIKSEIISKILKMSDEKLESIFKITESFNKVYIKKELVNISELINNSLDCVNTNNCKIIKNFDDSLYTMLDPLIIKEAFINLLKNAIESAKFVERETQITIKIISELKYIMVQIIDNGEGIKNKNIRKLFYPLYTTKSRKDNWGIGLYHCQKIINTHNGYLRLVSNKDFGTTAEVILPLKGRAYFGKNQSNDC